MFVSILQLMGFAVRDGGSVRRPVGANIGRAAPDNQGINRPHEGASTKEQGRLAADGHATAGASAARRPELKPQPKATAKAKKPAAKTAKPAAKAAKPAAKAAAKPVAKKAPAKVSKPAVKPAAKAPAKKAATPKPAPKPVAKAIAKTAPAATKSAPAPRPATPVTQAAPARAPIPVKTSNAATGRSPAPPAPVAPRPSPAVSAARAAAAAQPAPATLVKASYTPMANSSVLNPPPFVAIKKDPKLANNWKSKPVEALSDAEVLAMPDAEYMNEKQLAFFRLKLQQLKQEILDSAGETTEHLREETVIVPDPADRATIEEEHALELRTRDRERKLLKKIEQSIARIDAGDYGYCDETGEPIGVGRLLARPTATLSLEAQQRRELKQKMFGD